MKQNIGLTLKEASKMLSDAHIKAGISVQELTESLNNFKKQAIINKNKHKSIYHK